MTEHDDSRPPGILTPSERAVLSGKSGTPADRDQLRDDLRERFRATLEDLELLYLTLRDEDIEDIFDPADVDERWSVRAASQAGLTLLLLGMEANDDVTETRIADALAYAGASTNQAITADIDIVREPMAPVEHCLKRLERDGLAGISIVEFEHLLADPTVDAERLAAAFEQAGMDASVDDVRAERSRNEFKRLPQTVLANVAMPASEVPDHDRE